MWRTTAVNVPTNPNGSDHWVPQPSGKPSDANERQPDRRRTVDPPAVVRKYLRLAIGTNLLLVLSQRHDSAPNTGHGLFVALKVLGCRQRARKRLLDARTAHQHLNKFLPPLFRQFGYELDEILLRITRLWCL